MFRELARWNPSQDFSSWHRDIDQAVLYLWLVRENFPLFPIMTIVQPF